MCLSKVLTIIAFSAVSGDTTHSVVFIVLLSFGHNTLYIDVLVSDNLFDYRCID